MGTQRNIQKRWMAPPKTGITPVIGILLPDQNARYRAPLSILKVTPAFSKQPIENTSIPDAFPAFIASSTFPYVMIFRLFAIYNVEFMQ